VLVVLILVGVTAGAFANGRFPATVDVKFQPGNDNLVLLPVTFGLLLSEDDGANFRWICEEAVGYGGTYDPDYAINAAGHIYATTFSGLKVSTDGSCTYAPTQFFGDPTGGTNPILLTGVWVGEVETASDGKIWATTSTGGQSNDVFVSTDGTTFNSTNNWHATAWWKTLRVSESDPDVVYVSGFQIPDGQTPAFALLFKTVDGGANWTDLGVAGFAFGAQPNLLIEGVSPNDPNIAYARVLGARSPLGDDLYRTVDGGLNWVKVLEMAGTINAFATRSDDRVLVGTTTPCTEDVPMGGAGLPDKGCVRTSADGAAGSWVAPAIEPKVACIAERPSDQSLFACASNWDPDNFALGRSADNAESWSEVVRFADIAGPLDCPAGTTQQDTCAQVNWPSLCIMLGVCGVEDAGVGMSDAGVVDAAGVDDAASGATVDAAMDDPKAGSGCQTSGGGLGGLFVVLAICGWLFRQLARYRS
jgi:hypothetical protein